MEKRKVDDCDANSRPGIWGYKEVTFFLSLLKENNVIRTLDRKKYRYRNSQVYQSLVPLMKSAGFIRTFQQLRTKWKALCCCYRKVKPSNGNSGSKTSQCPFYEELEDILGDRQNVSNASDGIDSTMVGLQPSSMLDVQLVEDAEECKPCWRTYKTINEKEVAGSVAQGMSPYIGDNLRFLDIDRQEERELGDGGLNPIPTHFDTPLIYSNASLPLSAQCSVEDGAHQFTCNDDSGPGSSCEDDFEEANEEVVTKAEIADSSVDVATSSRNQESKRSGREAPEKKRRKIVGAKEKNRSKISKLSAGQLLIPKRIPDDRKPSDEDNPVFTFFKSMAQSVMLLPPNIIAETKIRTCQLVAEMEMKATRQRNSQVF